MWRGFGAGRIAAMPPEPYESLLDSVGGSVMVAQQAVGYAEEAFAVALYELT